MDGSLNLCLESYGFRFGMSVWVFHWYVLLSLHEISIVSGIVEGVLCGILVYSEVETPSCINYFGLSFIGYLLKRPTACVIV